MSETASADIDRQDASSTLRLLHLVRALDLAGACPINLRAIHSFVFFSNILSPLWNLAPFFADVLKDKRGPHYPAVQGQIDRLIANNVLIVMNFNYVQEDNESAIWLDATISVNDESKRPIDNLINLIPDERALWPYYQELALAFSEIKPDKQDDAALFDASYSDPNVSVDRPVGFSARVSNSVGPSVAVARQFQKYAPEGVILSRAEQLLMYMRLIKRRANG